MKAVFISDAHLKDLSDDNYRLVLNFLDSLKDKYIDMLVILGDLFDFFSGYNRTAHEHHKPILDKLLNLKNSGTKIIYLEGNHDFFMGRYFTETLNAQVYSDYAALTLDDKRIFMAHGDMINKKDYGYRLLRWFLRSWFMKLVFNVLPSIVVWRIANSMSKGSRTYRGKGFYDDILFLDFARGRWKEGYDAVMLGHSHNPAILKETANGKERFYINTGDWMRHFTYIIYEHGRFTLNFSQKN